MNNVISSILVCSVSSYTVCLGKRRKAMAAFEGLLSIGFLVLRSTSKNSRVSMVNRRHSFVLALRLEIVPFHGCESLGPPSERRQASYVLLTEAQGSEIKHSRKISPEKRGEEDRREERRA